MWAIIALNQSVQITLQREQPPAGFLINGEKFIRVTSGKGAIGHCDWLRPDPGRIIGIRLWHFSDGEDTSAVNELLEHLNGKKYAKVPEDGSCFLIFFSSSKAFNEALSSDQELCDSGLYYSRSGFILYLEVGDPEGRAIKAIQSGGGH